jgi:hypothetical protein
MRDLRDCLNRYTCNDHQELCLKLTGQGDRFSFSSVKVWSGMSEEGRVNFFHAKPGWRVARPLSHLRRCAARAELRMHRRGDGDAPVEYRQEFALTDEHEVVDRRTIGDDDHQLGRSPSLR